MKMKTLLIPLLTLLIIGNGFTPALAADVTGNVLTEGGDPVSNVDVELTASTFVMQTTTDGLGGFTFSGVPDNTTYTITLSKDINALNGVTTFDLLLIRQHILVLQNLNSPYKMLAADVNGSESIDVADILHILNLVLINTPTFPNNVPSWRFVPANVTLNSPPFPNPYPNSSTTISVTTGSSIQNFIGIKMGDMNNSVAP